MAILPLQWEFPYWKESLYWNRAQGPDQYKDVILAVLEIPFWR